MLLSLLAASALATPGPACRATVIATGAPIHGANGLALGPDGQLWIASGIGSEIVAVSLPDGAVTARLPAGGPDDVAFAPDGSLCWTEPFSGQVACRFSDGSSAVIAQLPPGANGIAFAPDGTLYVSTLLLSDTLWELDITGQTPARLITQDTLAGFNGFAVEPAGTLIGPRWFAGEVARADPLTGTVTTVATGLLVPLAVRLDTEGRPLVLDQGQETIFRLDPSTGELTPVADAGDNADNFAVAADGTLYVTSAQEGTVTAIAPDGAHEVLVPGGMIAPGGLVLHGRGLDRRLLVADQFALRHVNPLNGDETEVQRFDVGDPLSVGAPASLTDAGPHVAITSFLFNIVQLWDPDAREVVASWHDFIAPVNALAFRGDLAVADIAQGAVLRASDGEPYISGLPTPTGLASVLGELYVADWATGTIWRATRHGEPLAEPVLVADGLSGPEGLTADGLGLLVVEVGSGELSRVRLIDGRVTTLMSGLDVGLPAAPGAPPQWVAMSTAVRGALGHIYVSADRSGELLRVSCW